MHVCGPLAYTEAHITACLRRTDRLRDEIVPVGHSIQYYKVMEYADVGGRRLMLHVRRIYVRAFELVYSWALA